MRTRSVDSPHYHIWTDALHARHLARQTADNWNRGSYVRWAVISAWTAFEAACEDALAVTKLGNRFKEELNKAFDSQSAARPDWEKGLWQDVLRIYLLRKEYVHPGTSQKGLFPATAEADDAIRVLRLAIKDTYRRAGGPIPNWPNDDHNPADPRGLRASATLLRVGSDAPDAISIRYVVLDQEYESDRCAPNTDPEPLMENLLHNLQVPASHIRAYRGPQLIEEWEVHMRGS